MPIIPPISRTLGRVLGAFSEQRGWGSVPPIGPLCCVHWLLWHAETLDSLGKTDIILVSRALLASNPIERRGGPRFPMKDTALSLVVDPICSENAPPFQNSVSRDRAPFIRMSLNSQRSWAISGILRAWLDWHGWKRDSAAS